MSSQWNNRGFGLIEVVIAASIFSIVLVGVTAMIVNGQNGALGVQKNVSASQLQSFISSALNNNTICEANLVGKKAPAPGEHLPTLNIGGLLIDDSNHNLFDDGLIKVGSLTYKSVAVAGTTVSAVVELSVDLRGALGKQEVLLGGNKLAPGDIPLVVTVAGGKIVACGGGSSFDCAPFSKTQVTGGNVLVSCSPPYNNAMNGGCESVGRINVDYISGNTQICHQNGGLNLLTAHINCCK